jgi:hypothetical protein
MLPMKYIIAVMLLMLQPLFASAEEKGLHIEDFEQGLRPVWKEKVFKERTDYRVVREKTGKVLKAESHGAASALILEQKIDLEKFPVLTWRWKVENVLAKGDARKKEGDDYAARIYVIFPHWFFPKTRTINYIWANKLPQGAIVPNPFTSNAMMVAVESGEENLGEWIIESRNVYADYRAIFGEDPPLAGAIAIMTDTDNTGDSAVAWYDDIRFKEEEDNR